MDAFDSFHPVPAAWLRDSDLAPCIPAYTSRLVERHYEVATMIMRSKGQAIWASSEWGVARLRK